MTDDTEIPLGNTQHVRRQLSILSGLALAAALILTPLWLRSAWIIDEFRWPNWSITIGRGTVEIIHYTQDSAQYKFEHWWHSGSGPDQLFSTNIQFYNSIILPLWIFALPPLALAVFYAWWRNHWRNYMVRRGLCRSCGYDLRATPTRCPECGEKSPAGK
ncbi:MAG TPA: hypothetical protein VIL86_16155 [Tepidisphaeraceae bacterium]|jgi:hypothetical protein